jgi:hypothetical protein
MTVDMHCIQEFNNDCDLFYPGIDILENQVKEAKQMVEESDIKYDEVARKLAMVNKLIYRGSRLM